MTPHDEITKLTESLRLTQAELAQARFQLEQLAEEKASADATAAQLKDLAAAVATHLDRVGTIQPGPRGWVKRRLLRHVPSDAEAANMELMRNSVLFDPTWYVSEYPEVAGSGLAPALHYLRRGASENKNPGPFFSTRAYKQEHPKLGRRNPLIHHLKSADAS